MSAKMPNLVILGAQWGDEGKGKIVDLLSFYFSFVARYQGGHNAGHTIWHRGKKFVLHLIPSGILHPHVVCVIGNGVVVDLSALFAELAMLAEAGVDVSGRLLISDRAHLILPYHKDRDEWAETLRGDRKIGTTNRGIGPCYEDKIARRGIRFCDLAELTEGSRAYLTLVDNVAQRNVVCGEPHIDVKVVADYLSYAWPTVRPFVIDTSKYLYQAMREGHSLMFEGAQGTHLDIDHGTYPYVTSSNATAGGAATGLGIGPTSIKAVLGIAKAYTTRVGEGTLPTELNDEVGERMRKEGQEFGASTGRARRCGWYDAVAVRYSVRVNGLDALAITKLDVLDGFDELKICVAYGCPGGIIDDMPADSDKLSECEPIYETMPGWDIPTRGVTCFRDLHPNAQAYIRRLEQVSGVPVKLVTNGQDRNAFIVRHDVNVPVLDWLNTALKYS